MLSLVKGSVFSTTTQGVEPEVHVLEKQTSEETDRQGRVADHPQQIPLYLYLFFCRP
jgi:hypothetical protein